MPWASTTSRAAIPASNEKDCQYFQRVGELPLKHARVCAFGMTRRKGVTAAEDRGLRALLDSGTTVITIVGKSVALPGHGSPAAPAPRRTWP